MRADIQIFLTGLEWATDDPLEANIFNSSLTPTVIQPRTDVTNFLMLNGFGGVKQSFEGVDENKGTNELFGEKASITFKFSDLKTLADGTTLRDFFGVFEDNTFRKYKIELYYGSSSKIFEGVVYQDGFEEDFPEDMDGRAVISIMAVSYESEFKEYFSNKEMPLWEDLDYFVTLNIIKVPGFPEQNLTRECIPFEALVRYIYFPGIEVEIDPEVARDGYAWYIIDTPVFHAYNTIGYTENTNVFWNPIGYKTIQQTGESMYGFIEKFCNAMGWVFYFDKLKLVIKQRGGDTLLPTTTLTGLMNYKIKKKRTISDFKYIVIMNGQMLGGLFSYYSQNIFGKVRGAKFIILDNEGTEVTFMPHFKWITGPSGSALAYRFSAKSGLKFNTFSGESDTTFSYNEFYFNGNGVNPVSLSQKLRSIPKEQILFIDGGDVGNNMYKIDLRNGQGQAIDNYPAGIEDYHFVFNSNYAGCALMFNPPVFGESLYTQKMAYYHLDDSKSYIKTAQFRKCFTAYFDSKINLVLELESKEEMLSPYYKVTVDRTEEEFAGRTFAITDYEFDPVEDVVKLELIAENG